MRTATTIAEKHDGSEVLISGRKVPIQEQLADFRQLLGRKSHPEFSLVQIQESDGHSRVLRFLTPEGEKKEAAARELESKKLKALAAKGEQAKAKAEEDRIAEKEKKHSDHLEVLNKQRLADPNRFGSGAKGKASKADGKAAETPTETETK